MKIYLIVISLLASISSFAKNNQKIIPNSLYPFTTDGCSIVPDMGMIKCCIIHDLAYWQGGTKEDRKVADKKLASCVKNKSNSLLSSMFYWGVRIGGTPELLTSFRWGYGWKYAKSYGKLSSSELEEVAHMTPRNVLDVELTPPENRLEIVPVRFGNYCMDEMYDFIDKYYNNESVGVKTLRKSSDQYQTKIVLRMENGQRITFLYPNKKWEQCQKPIYNEIVPRFYRRVIIE